MSMARRTRLLIATLLAIVLHGLAAIGLLHPKDAPVDEGVVMEVILAAPPRPARAAAPSGAASRSEQNRVPTLAGKPGPPIATRKGDKDAAFDWRVRVPAGEESEGVRGTLRTKLGCERTKFLALTAEEQAACDEKLAQGAREARAYAVISPKLKKQFDGVFECPKDDVWCEYRIGKAPYPGLLQLGRKKRSEWD